jgi:hypothetical protein
MLTFLNLTLNCCFEDLPILTGREIEILPKFFQKKQQQNFKLQVYPNLT